MKIDPTFLHGVCVSQLPNDPSVVNAIPLSYLGKAMGVYYRFQTVGLGLPAHTHTDCNLHFTVVVAGQIEVVRASTGATPALYSAGDLVDFAAGDEHSITAVQPETVIVNLIKYGLNVASMAAEIQAISANLATAMTAARQLAADLTVLPTP